MIHVNGTPAEKPTFGFNLVITFEPAITFDAEKGFPHSHAGVFIIDFAER
jgi:hypothetical protein